jgi:hypothetical protein
MSRCSCCDKRLPYNSSGYFATFTAILRLRQQSISYARRNRRKRRAGGIAAIPLNSDVVRLKASVVNR